MTLEELERCVQILFAHARRSGVSSVSVTTRDYYWTTMSPERWSMNATAAPGVGSLCDDIAELRKLIAAPDRASANDFDRLACLLGVISDQLSGT